MLIAVEHVTTYRYDRPVRGVVQSHRLTPAEFDGQRVLSWDVAVTDGVKGGGFRDGAGDWIQGWTVSGPVSEIAVTVRGLVETVDNAGLLRGHREKVPPMVWLTPTAATRPDDAIRALAIQSRGAGEALAQVHAMADAVAAAVVWTPGKTRAHTTASEALALGEGVCQDHAQVLIAAARAGGFPARYATGYMLDAPDEGDAAHAWAEVWVEGLGWVGFDPANRCCPDARYVRLGSGRDAQDAAPIRGTTRGAAGEESMAVSLRVAQGQVQTQQ
ncbi:MAG: transglutaminase family protein [Paracoccaceae bacterium]|nr:MAG: transglutaminase family protein [Paracoccaceae bacterium]